MTSILKAQIIKHLAKIFKNLSPESLNLSTLRGQCALHNLELNESVLMEILEFPVWLNLKKAVCNKAFINVPWTKIKSQPVYLNLDQVYIEIETCENFRQNNSYFNHLSNLSSRKYGFGEKVIDDLKIKIDSVEVRFFSSVFTAHLCLLQIFVESRSPSFKPIDNTNNSKIKNLNKSQILLFKYIEWSSLRFEARSESIKHSSPLRLITRNGSCKIILKKSLLDCSTLSARLILNFDDLLWILTDSTILSAIHLLMYITELINKAPMTKKNLMEFSSPKLQAFKKNLIKDDINLDALFNKFNIIETSLHLIINRLQLHLSDDFNRSSFCPLKEGGGLYIILQKFLLDFYPYHKAISPRNHWLLFKRAPSNQNIFFMNHLKTFFTLLLGESNYSNLFSNSFNDQSLEIDKKLKDLLSFTILLRIGDYKINCVSTSKSKNKKENKFCKENSDKVLISTGVLPKDVSAIYIEINQYYYNDPGSNRLSTRLKSPAPTLFLNIAPCIINFDLTTFLWINAFYSSIHNSIVKFTTFLPQNENKTDFHFLFEIISPTFSINFENLYENEILIKNEYDFLEVKSKKITLTNSINNLEDIKNLNDLLHKMSLNQLFNDKKNYPWINSFDCEFNLNKLSTYLKNEINKTVLGYHNQIFVLNSQSIWIDFKNSITSKFIDSFPLTIWINLNPIFVKEDNDDKILFNPEICLFCFLPELKICFDHQNYLFIIRLLERIDFFFNILESDFIRIQKNEKEIQNIIKKSSLILIIGILPKLNLYLKLNEIILDNYFKKNSFIDDVIEDNFSENLNQFTDTKYKKELCKDLKCENLIKFPIEIEENIEKVDEISLISTSINKNLKIDSQIDKSLIKNNNNTSSSVLNKILIETDVYEEDTKSILSNLSIESEKFVFNLDDYEDSESLIFRENYDTGNFDVEEAIEVVEDENLQENKESIENQNNLYKKNSLITFLKINLSNIAFIKQNKDFISSLLLTINQIRLESFYQVPYQIFEENFKNCLDENLKTNEINNSTVNDNILARLDSNLLDKNSNLLSVVFQNLNLPQLNTKLINDLNEFFLDSDAIKISNVNFIFQNLNLEIKDDKIKLPPISINLNNIILNRNSHNKVKIYPKTIINNGDLLLEHQKILPVKIETNQ